ncbi:hypothetical protein [Streptomyces radicis]|uniref:Uncharacterized protein n=1 Tax=Streptomyces radicis TaxID=1750517 RepID=A0A3A9W7I4_9ACTN|nr:hypothetical protein [Streptomyces radicis]RKN08343.1 hypothetical protein D7319_15500 [Streptomyces radicis]RKN21621.1 hypothetical protein D7318_16965 [Streptomyces radicis]
MRRKPLATLLAALAAAAALTATAGQAAADTNRNVHSPSLLCGPGPLSATAPEGARSTCAARQVAAQRVTKSGTRDASLIDYVSAALPATVG